MNDIVFPETLAASWCCATPAPSGDPGTVELLEAMLGCADAAGAARLLAERLPASIDAAGMAVAAVDRKGMCRLLAVSGKRSVDRRSDHTRALESALDEAVARGGAILWSRTGPNTPAAKTHEQLERVLRCDWIASASLRGAEGRLAGAWLAWGEGGVVPMAAGELLGSNSRPVAAALRTLVRAGRGPLARFADEITARVGGKNRRRALIALAGAVAVVGLLPLPYRLHCDCTVEPVVRRYVAAPFEATLAESLVQPGDVVAEGDELARLDGREIRWELAALQAEHAQAQKSRDSAMAERNTSAAQLARLDMTRVEQQIALLEERERELVVRCPIDGVVVSGDIRRAQGAPVTTGQTLFEVAPLERVLIEVAIPEEEIAYAEAGARVGFRLDAFPGRSWEGTLQRIHPKAEVLGGRQVFVAEVEVANADNLLRPGMSGRAKVRGPRAPLGWILLHKPLEAAGRWLGW